jgi:hypothetical protein
MTVIIEILSEEALLLQQKCRDRGKFYTDWQYAWTQVFTD